MWRGMGAPKRIALVLAVGALWITQQTIPNAKAQGEIQRTRPT
jgi:hypothetical protein